MPDTNGHVDPNHLALYQGVWVSAAILPDLRAAGDEFRQSGYTFSIALPWGGYRPFLIQGEMRSDFLGRQYARFNLSPPPSPAPAEAGYSRHGYGRAVDVISNAPLAKRDAIMAKHGFHLWATSDRNHYEWGNVLTPAAVSSTPLPTTVPPKKKDENMNGLKYIQRPTGPQGQTQWALLGVQFPDGAIVTQDVKVANGWAALSDNGGTVLDDTHWQPTLDAAKVASDDYWARMTKVTTPGAGGDYSALTAALNALAAKLDAQTAATTALPAEIDRYADGRKQSS